MALDRGLGDDEALGDLGGGEAAGDGIDEVMLHGGVMTAWSSRTRSRASRISGAEAFAGLAGVSTLGITGLLRGDASEVIAAVRVRGSIVAVGARVLFLSAGAAARGSHRVYRRPRVPGSVMVVAIVVIVAIPGTFPGWLKIGQGVCGFPLTYALAVPGSRRVRARFASSRPFA